MYITEKIQLFTFIILYPDFFFFVHFIKMKKRFNRPILLNLQRLINNVVPRLHLRVLFPPE